MMRETLFSYPLCERLPHQAMTDREDGAAVRRLEEDHVGADERLDRPALPRVVQERLVHACWYESENPVAVATTSACGGVPSAESARSISSRRRSSHHESGVADRLVVADALEDERGARVELSGWRRYGAIASKPCAVNPTPTRLLRRRGRGRATDRRARRSCCGRPRPGRARPGLRCRPRAGPRSRAGAPGSNDVTQ